MTREEVINILVECKQLSKTQRVIDVFHYIINSDHDVTFEELYDKFRQSYGTRAYFRKEISNIIQRLTDVKLIEIKNNPEPARYGVTNNTKPKQTPETIVQENNNDIKADGIINNTNPQSNSTNVKRVKSVKVE